MKDPAEFTAVCPLPLAGHDEIQMAHGSGGTLTHQLIEEMFLPAFDNPYLAAQHDGAAIDVGGARLAFTTDSYVVRPWAFPGGDIGALAVIGTVNDLAMCGARPLYLSAGLILEEGFAMADLERVIASMKAAADSAGVQLVTGDTKVVDKGCGDGIFINTSGIGQIMPGVEIGPGLIRPGDALVLSGDVGRHGMAVMAAREGLEFETAIESDMAPLWAPVLALIKAGVDLRCLRDLTRGGLATGLVEIAQTTGLEIGISESSVPVSDVVRGAAEILGLDPLYVANEGRFIAFVPPEHLALALDVLGRDPLGAGACAIGRVGAQGPGGVTATTAIGGQRVLDMLSGEQLPRIC